MNEKQLLRNFRFRDYLKELRIDRKLFKVLPLDIKANIVQGFKDLVTN